MFGPLPLPPIWLISLLLFAAMFAAATAGRRLATRDANHVAVGEVVTPTGEQTSYVVAAVTGLLALLLGFTFSLAIDRFEARRELVVNEANVISKNYLRAQLLDEPHRSRIGGLLREYLDVRIALGSARRPAENAELMARDDSLITDLWAATNAAFASIKEYDFSSTFVDGMNELVDTGVARKAARYARVPSIVFVLLVVYEVLTAALLGYVLTGPRGRATGVILILLFGVSLLLILDIDRPTIGSIKESQAPMIWLRQSLVTWPTGTFDRFNAAPH
jgi:hypothetical protein